MDGTDSFVAQAHIPELDVTVVVVQPYSEVLSGLRQFNIVSIALSLVIVALGTIMALAVANNLIKPLKSLREATEAMAGGDTLRMAEVTTRDEIGMLAESFNRMGQSLHKSYEELEEQNLALVKLDHMKDALISDVSHELKTPVAKQVMQLEMLKHEVARSGGPNKQMRTILQVMEGNIRRQQNVIRNILMVSRLETGGRELKIEKVRLDNILEDVIADHIHLISTYGIQLEQNTREETVDSDREMLWHVFSNCISNAIKYRSIRDPRISITVDRTAEVATVRVEDNGIGLTEEEAENAFKRFFQSTPTSDGIGLGLSISRSIVEMMGGTIRIESPGRSLGTMVTVSLPLSAE